MTINSLAPERFESNFMQANLRLILVIEDCGISSETAVRWMAMDFTHNTS